MSVHSGMRGMGLDVCVCVVIIMSGGGGGIIMMLNVAVCASSALWDVC